MNNLDLIVQDIESILLSQGAHLPLVFSNLRHIKQNRKETVATCPFCEKPGKFYVSHHKPLWHCFRCDRSGNWFQYLEEQEGLSFWPALARLGDAAGVPLPDQTQGQLGSYQTYLHKASLLEAAHTHFQEQLWSTAGQSVLAYAHSRGYQETDIRQMKLGAYLHPDKLVHLLQQQGYTEQDIQATGLLLKRQSGEGLGVTHQLAIPYQDRAGRLMGFQFRPAMNTMPTHWQKYLNTRGLQKSHTLPGLQVARGAKEVVIVESPLAALYLNAQELSLPVVALGGKNLATEQLRLLQQLGTKRFILALDIDEAHEDGHRPGQEATARLIQKLLNQKEVDSILIASWLRPEDGGAKALDDLALQKGLPAVEQAIHQAQRLSAWFAHYIVTQIDLSQPEAYTLEEERALEKAVDIYLQLEDPLDRRDFVDTLSKTLGLHPDYLWPRLQIADKRQKEKEQQDVLQALLHTASQKGREEGILAAEHELEQGLQRLKSKRGAKLPEPYLLTDLDRDLQDSPPALPTGFKALADTVAIPQAGLSVIAALSGHGKTSMMLNLLVNWLGMKAYQERHFYFFTYEEPAADIALKLIILWAGVTLHPEQNFEAYKNYWKYHRGENPAIEAAIQRYQVLTQAKRLIISDTILRDEDLVATIDTLGKKGNMGAILIDYIQLIPALKASGTRQLELANTARLLREQAVTHHLALVTGSQLNEQDKPGRFISLRNLREARDIGNEARLVLGLYNESKMTEQSADFAPDKYARLRIDVSKQRGGVSGPSWSQYLHMDGSTLKISDKPTLTTPLDMGEQANKVVQSQLRY